MLQRRVFNMLYLVYAIDSNARMTHVLDSIPALRQWVGILASSALDWSWVIVPSLGIELPVFQSKRG